MTAEAAPPSGKLTLARRIEIVHIGRAPRAIVCDACIGEHETTLGTYRAVAAPRACERCGVALRELLIVSSKATTIRKDMPGYEAEASRKRRETYKLRGLTSRGVVR